jgi:putative Mg2+ transporter-C (MgtC) family protein
VELNGEWLLRLFVAALLGALIGWEREQAQRPAGLRTYMLVSFGSALFTILSADKFFGSPADPSRIAAQVVVGIGFLGAGTVFREGDVVRGLTTAAGLWTMAAVGMAVGMGRILLAIVSTMIVLGILWGVRLFERRKKANNNH